MAAKLAFAAKHLATLQGFLHGTLTAPQLKEGAALLAGLTTLLQARHVKLAKERMAEWVCTSFDSGGGQVFRSLKGGIEPDTMTSTFFSSITTDPMQVLDEKLAEWRKIWKCDDPEQRDKTCRAIRAAIAEALAARDYDGVATHIHSGSQINGAATSFKQTTSIGGDN